MQTLRLLSLAVFLTLGVSTANAVDHRIVALSGNQAPGTAGGTEYSNLGFGSPALNDLGQTAFTATVHGPTVVSSNNSGIWSEGSGSGLSLVIREGALAPGTPNGARYSYFTATPSFNNAGHSAFRAVLTGSGINGDNDEGIWSDGGGSGLSLIARLGNQAPGAPNGVGFDRLYDPVLNGAGQTAFRATQEVTGDHGIWSEGGGGGLSPVAREGVQAPGAPSGAVFTTFYTNPITTSSINDSGHTIFSAGLTGPGINSSNDTGVWSDREGAGLSLVAREGDPAPGMPSGVNFFGFGGLPSLNSVGQTAFISGGVGPGVDSSNNTGIWSDGSGAGLSLVARKGAPAPGTASGTTFDFFFNPFINSNGRTAFRANVAGPGVGGGNNEGIWKEADTGLTMVAREGDPAPGTPSGVLFSSFSGSSYEPVINSSGQIAFLMRLTGTGVTSSNRFGLWAQNPLGELTLVVRNGDMIDVDEGPGVDLRTVSGIFFENGGGRGASTDDGRPRGFNDQGQVAFRADFTDGTSGIFVSDMTAVPEPSTALLLLILTLATLLSYRIH